VDKDVVAEKVKKARAKKKAPTYRCRTCGAEFKKPSVRTQHEIDVHQIAKRT
jgi:hypothetical protein